MTRSQRGGLTLKTGKIGRVNCLRQQMAMPGERINISLNGSVRLESLRERDVMRIHAHLGVFLTPIRWLWSDWPDYVKQGNDTLLSPPTVSAQKNWSSLGIGAYDAQGDGTYLQWYRDAYLRVYSEWYKWPEDPDPVTVAKDGEKAVPLSTAWSRCRYDATPDDSSDYEIDVSGATMDVRDLADRQARFRSAMKRDVLSYNRWMELVDETWRGDGSREVDKVPIMLDQVEVGVNPREIPATDGASLGQWQSLFDFGINHQIRGVVAPEHSIITYMLTVRFPPITEGVNPLATNQPNWFELVGDPEYFAARQPVSVQRRDLWQSNSATSLGFLPAGWQWRHGFDVIGERVDIRDSFPMQLAPTTQAEAKDATRVRDAFRSQALGDYLVDCYITEDSNMPIGTALDSYMSGMVDDARNMSNTSDEFPKGGKML